MLEQPFPAGTDGDLATLPKPLPVCADESCHDVGSLESLSGLCDAVNIKLDKAGGLTEALWMKALAKERGFAVMVGCMVATSLAMAPAFLVAQGARYCWPGTASRDCALKAAGSIHQKRALGLGGYTLADVT